MNFYKLFLIINFIVFIYLSLLFTTGCTEQKKDIDLSPILNEISITNGSLKDIEKNSSEVINKIKELENANLQTKKDALNYYFKSNLDFKEKLEKIMAEVSKNGITEEERKNLFGEIKKIEKGLNKIDTFTKGIEKIEPPVFDDKGKKKIDLGTAARITDPTMERIANKVVEALKDPNNSPDPKIQDDKNKAFADLLLKSIIKSNENLAKDISLSKDQKLQFSINAQKDEQIKNLKSELDDLKLILKNEKTMFNGNKGNIAILLTNSTEFKISKGLLGCILETAEKQRLKVGENQKIAVYVATASRIDVHLHEKEGVKIKNTEIFNGAGNPTETLSEVGQTFNDYAFEGKAPIPVPSRKAIIIATWSAEAPKFNASGWKDISQIDAILIQPANSQSIRYPKGWLDLVNEKNGRLLLVSGGDNIEAGSKNLAQLEKHLLTLLNTKKD
jgi:hypothetical protein